MTSEQLIKELPKGLLKWYEFHKGSRALYVTGVDIDQAELDESIVEALQECGLQVTSLSMKELERSDDNVSEQRYDYAVLVGALERSNHPVSLLTQVRRLLTEEGKLLLGVDNRLGIRYFCGDRDVFTGRNFDGIENYARVSQMDIAKQSGRAYAKAEVCAFLEQAGFLNHRFYSVFPLLERPQVLYAEDYLPEEQLEVRLMPQYTSPKTVFLEEERLYASLIENGLFHAMANGYLVECVQLADFSNVKHVTITMDRGRECAMCTSITEDSHVIKKAVYEEGNERLHQLLENQKDLTAHGVKMIDAGLEESQYIMPYVKGEAATAYFRRILQADKDLFQKEFRRFCDVILHSSEAVAYDKVDWSNYKTAVSFESEEEKQALGVILKRGYIDLVSLNCFYIDGEFIFYDQEFCMEHLPANVMIQRTIDMIYRDNSSLEVIFPKQELEKIYHLDKNRALWYECENRFLVELRKESELALYHKNCRRDAETLHSNRQRMNYSSEEYLRLFVHVFEGLENKQLFLFGSGRFTEKFLDIYKDAYPIAGILDNNEAKQGQTLQGIKIQNPAILRDMDASTYKVIICIKNYVGVLHQVQSLGAKNIGIYDTNMIYPRKENVSVGLEVQNQSQKKYHVGYVAGVFDLFHIGHLNLLRRAKEQCDYLIVGVVVDDNVKKNKHTETVIPLEERMAMVEACRYVDEVVKIPKEYGDTKDAYQKFHFDVQFSGSDYENDPLWLEKQAWLRERGADLVFFPYTQSTSSTKLKAVIEKKLKQ